MTSVDTAWVIRPYAPEDYDALVEITRRAWGGVTMAELRERTFGYMGGQGWQEHKVRDVMGSVERGGIEMLVAEFDGQVVGYASFDVRDAGDVGVVGNNAVDPDWRGRGIGTSLVARAMEILVERGAKVLEVTTFSHDASARRVYEKVGFHEIATSVHYAMRVPTGSEDQGSQ